MKMISFNDQNELFELISARLKKDVICYAFGGTAMLFYGYKDATKDIDLIFDSEEDKKEFIEAIESLGYKQKSLVGVYDEEHMKRSGKPIMYSRGDERFDIFIKKIFTTPLIDSMKKDFHAQYDYTRGDKTLIVRALSKESIVILKAVTDRERDFEDIAALLEKDSRISWDRITDIALDLSKRDKWVVLDLERIMQRLKKKVFIPEKYFKKLYTAKYNS